MKNDNRIKITCLTIAFVTACLLTGCGHNANFVASGKVFKIGSEGVGLLYVNGLVAVNGTRENSESVIEAGDNDSLSGAPSSDAKTLRTVRFRTGPQLNGYLVKLAKENPEAANAYVKQMYKLNTNVWDVKETIPGGSSKSKSSGKSEKKESSDESSEKSGSSDAVKDTIDKIKDSDYIQSLIEKVKSLDKKNGTEGQSGKADADDYAKTPEFAADGNYTDLYIYETVDEQRKMAQILAKLDDGGRKFETGETYKQTLEHFLDRLDKVEKWGGVNTAMRLKYATIEGGKLTGLLYIMFEDDRVFDVDCPSCHSIENAVYDDDGNPVYPTSKKGTLSGK